VGKKRRHNPTIPSGRIQGRKSPAKKPPEIKYVLDQFTDVDLRTWKKTDANLTEYQIRFFYHLEAQRATRRQEILEALQSVTSVDQDISQWVRLVSYKYSLNPLSSRGSLNLYGGRFNFGRDLDCASLMHFNALYIASDKETSYSERVGIKSTGKLDRFDLALQKEESFSTFLLEGHIYNLFDLTNANNLKPFIKVTNGFGISPELKQIAIDLTIDTPHMICSAKELKAHLMASNWRHWPMQYDVPYNSQVFGELLVRSGYDGVIYHSTHGTGMCIAIFPHNLMNSDTSIRIVGDPPNESVITHLDSNTWRDLI
jgi:hypothetical protein